MKEIYLNSEEPLEVVGFKVKEHPVTTHNDFRRDKGNTAEFFSFVLLLLDFLISLTSGDLVLNISEKTNSYREDRHTEIKKLSNWLTEMQFKGIDKEVKKSIL